MKIAYFGLPLGACLLAAQGHSLDLVVLSPVAAPGRRRLRRLCPNARLVDFLEKEDEAAVERTLARQRPDLLLSWFWTRRLPDRWLAAPALGAFNVHPSLLPRHRGPNPYFAAIDAGDRVTGVTLHRLDASYDTGPIVAAETLDVGERDAWQLARALDRPSLRLLVNAARWAREGRRLRGTPQRERDATWAGEPEGSQLCIDWTWSAERALRRIRALAPVPGLALEVHGVKFFASEARVVAAPAIPLLPGEASLHTGMLIIRTADAAISIERAVLPDSDQELDRIMLGRHLAEHATDLELRARKT